MAHPYPLAFPDTRQLCASSYSTLSGALEPTPPHSGYSVRPNTIAYTDGIPISTYLRAQSSSNLGLSDALGPAPSPFQSQHHNITPQANTPNATYSSHPHALGYEEPSSVDLQYPYPQRNIVHPAKYTGPMPPAAYQRPSYKTIIPTGYRRLSTSPCAEKEGARPSSWSRIGTGHATIKFNRRGGGKPFRVSELIKTNETPDVEGKFDQVFKNIGDRYIKVILTWPGYSGFPVERRICTENGTLTRDKLLVILAKHIEEFVDYAKGVRKVRTRVEATWAVQHLERLYDH